MKEDELTYKHPSGSVVQAAYAIGHEATLKFSLVIPAYNERQRLPPTLIDCCAYLDARARADSQFTWEIIVVDDCSRDGTALWVEEYFASRWKGKRGPNAKRAENGEIRCIRLPRNLGKGGAVTVVCGSCVYSDKTWQGSHLRGNVQMHLGDQTGTRRAHSFRGR